MRILLIYFIKEKEIERERYLNLSLFENMEKVVSEEKVLMLRILFYIIHNSNNLYFTVLMIIRLLLGIFLRLFLCSNQL